MASCVGFVVVIVDVVSGLLNQRRYGRRAGWVGLGWCHEAGAVRLGSAFYACALRPGRLREWACEPVCGTRDTMQVLSRGGKIWAGAIRFDEFPCVRPYSFYPQLSKNAEGLDKIVNNSPTVAPRSPAHSCKSDRNLGDLARFDQIRAATV